MLFCVCLLSFVVYVLSLHITNSVLWSIFGSMDPHRQLILLRLKEKPT